MQIGRETGMPNSVKHAAGGACNPAAVANALVTLLLAHVIVH
jgi:hypothetical protein